MNDELSIEKLLELRENIEIERRRWRDTLLDYPFGIIVDYCFKYQMNSFATSTKQNMKNYLKHSSSFIPFDWKLKKIYENLSNLFQNLEHDKNLSNIQKLNRVHAHLSIFKILREISDFQLPKVHFPTFLKHIRKNSLPKYDQPSTEKIIEFLTISKDVNHRDSLVLHVMYEAKMNMHKVLGLEVLDLEELSKKLSHKINRDLDLYVIKTDYLRCNHDKIFITNQGKPLYRTQVQKTIDKTNELTTFSNRIISMHLCKTNPQAESHLPEGQKSLASP